MQKKILSLFLLFCLVVFGCTGCVKFELANPENGYNTEFAMSALEYSMFVNKQIGVVENQLLTRMSMGESVSRGEYEISKELENTEESLSKMADIKNEVTVTMPATNYESDRENLLNLIEDSIVAITGYRDALKNSDKTKISSCVTEMKACYIALGGEGNNYYE